MKFKKEKMTRSSTRQELAYAAGVSSSTMKRWLRRVMPQLKELGYKHGDRIFSPAVTDFICRHFAIELDGKPP